MLDIIILLTLSGIILFMEYSHSKERKDLMDRIMAKNFIEYKDNTQPEEKPEKEEKDETVELADAKDEIYGESDE